MTPIDKLQTRTIIISIILIPLTILSIYFIYGCYLFAKWPWMKFSIVISTLTCLWTYTFWFTHNAEVGKNNQNPFFFGFMIIPFEVLLMYPGTETLGIDSDPDMYKLLIMLEVLHGFGFYFIQREIKKYLYDIASS